MVALCLYFQVHIPPRLRKYTVFNIGRDKDYFDEQKEKELCERLVRKCYLPANQLLLELINRFEGRFKVSFCLSGIALDMLEKYCPEAIESFKRLARTGCVEFLAETYYHSLASFFSPEEFTLQVKEHQERIKQLFGYEPRVFRNTELIYDNALARLVEKLGYQGIVTEGAEQVLGKRSPDLIYKPKGAQKIKLLLKNHGLSEDISSRFADRTWVEWPLQADKYVSWLDQVKGHGQLVNLFLDYQTLGEYNPEETGIFEFMRHLPEEFLRRSDNSFRTLSEALSAYPVSGELDVPQAISWDETEHDLSSWLGNRIQHDAAHSLYALENAVKTAQDPALLITWRKLTVSDHLYHMCTKWSSNGNLYKYFNPYQSPYDAYINFMNILEDLRQRLSVEKAISRSPLMVKTVNI